MNDSGEKQPQWFHTTQWSQVLLARDEGKDRAARDAERPDAVAEAAARARLMGSATCGATAADEKDARVAERDDAVRRVLLKSSTTLKRAAGLKYSASEDDVRKRVRTLLRLLHPDYSLNQPLLGSKQYGRIEAAFKKLSALRDA